MDRHAFRPDLAEATLEDRVLMAGQPSAFPFAMTNGFNNYLNPMGFGYYFGSGGSGGSAGGGGGAAAAGTASGLLTSPLGLVQVYGSPLVNIVSNLGASYPTLPTLVARSSGNANNASTPSSFAGSGGATVSSTTTFGYGSSFSSGSSFALNSLTVYNGFSGANALGPSSGGSSSQGGQTGAGGQSNGGAPTIEQRPLLPLPVPNPIDSPGSVPITPVGGNPLQRQAANGVGQPGSGVLPQGPTMLL